MRDDAAIRAAAFAVRTGRKPRLAIVTVGAGSSLTLGGEEGGIAGAPRREGAGREVGWGVADPLPVMRAEEDGSYGS